MFISIIIIIMIFDQTVVRPCGQIPWCQFNVKSITYELMCQWPPCARDLFVAEMGEVYVRGCVRAHLGVGVKSQLRDIGHILHGSLRTIEIGIYVRQLCERSSCSIHLPCSAGSFVHLHNAQRCEMR